MRWGNTNDSSRPSAKKIDEIWSDRVRADWMAERLAAETRAAVERVRARYVVERR